ncbi:Ig-like domain-containing protein [Pedobacter helvus]|uniref:Ig-like domain-containing protein n=1 Tax=Pedobacter helvus TaxID=2563444 RepID=A0ABW9JLJ4_9SPHI|nr:T9SS type A sorting domain-containing protein [Pedobacter ureilyticus]
MGFNDPTPYATSTVCASFTVSSAPATPSPSSNTPVCTGNTINLTTAAVAGATYSWTGPNGFSSSLQNPSINNATAAMAGTYSVTVTVSGTTSAAGTTAVVVNAKPVTPSPSSNTPVCTGNTINLSTPAVAGATYSWTGPNSFSSSLQNPSINNATAAMAGTYSVTVTTNGCTSTAGTTAVVVNAKPATPSPSSNTPVCTGNTINLTTAAVAGATYSWTGPNGFSSSLQNPTINNATAAMAGTYSVTVTTNGCTSAAGTTAVVVNAKPATPSPSSNSPVCTGNTINLSTPIVAGATYSWTGPNSFSSSLQNPTINNATAAMAGTYSVTVTTNGCTSAAGTTSVVVNTAPTANNDALTVLGNSAATVVDVLANDQANTLGQTLTVTAITQPANGTATLIAGVVRYTPATGFSGNTSFTYTIAGSICGTSTATVNVTVSPDPLPVTIAKGLTLKKEADGVRLTWTTASETNNSKFIIYRGGNDTQLAELKMIDGKINSSVLQDYSFLDSRPLIGVNYYRLAQVDLDGKKSILGEKAIEYQIAHPELAVYPNPTTGKITLDFAPKKYQKVQLTSIHGSVLMEQTISSSSSQCSFEMSRLPAGTYLIRLSGTGGVLHSKVVRK